MKCKCGCGTEVKQGNTFIKGHIINFQRGKTYDEIYGKYKSENFRRKLSEIRLRKKERDGFLVSHETRKKISEALKKAYRNGTKRTNSEKIKGHQVSHETRKKISLAKMGKPNPKLSKTLKRLYKEGKKGLMWGKRHSKETIEKMSETKIGKKMSLEARKNMREKRKEQWLNPDYRKMMSQSHKKLWEDPEYVRRMMTVLHTRPNKPEKELDKLIHQVTDDFKYNGDFSQGITIGGKIPDFVNCNGKKQVIELFGDAFHNPEKAFIEVDMKKTYQGTMSHYKKYGFNCLIIWDYELRESENIIKKIREFVCQDEPKHY